MVGVGMMPPKVLGAPKPWSSVMMSSTLGAPFGGTTRGAHQGVDSEAFSLITPPNFGSGGGSWEPGSGAVAPGEPGATGCWASAGAATTIVIARLKANCREKVISDITIPPWPINLKHVEVKPNWVYAVRLTSWG